MAWDVHFSKAAERDFSQLDKTVRRRVASKIEWLAEHFDDTTPLPLTGNFKDFYKLRVGDWRVFYRINWKAERISIEYIDHRSKAYK